MEMLEDDLEGLRAKPALAGGTMKRLGTYDWGQTTGGDEQHGVLR